MTGSLRRRNPTRILVNGVRLNCYQTGVGPDLVMIHGLAANLAFWYLRIVPLLSRQFRVTAFDLRGHGYSEMPFTGYTSSEMARDLGDLLDRLNIGCAHLVGHSFGGAIALQCAALFPQRVRTVTVADGRIRALQPRQKISDWPFWERWKSSLDELELEIDGDQEFDFTLLEKLAHRALLKPLRTVRNDRTFLPFSGWNGGYRNAETWLRLLTRTNARKELQSPEDLTTEILCAIEHPTLAIYGEYSFCLPSCDGLRACLQNCEVQIVPGAGHYHPVIQPAFFLETVRSFIERHDRRAPEDAIAS
jgi:pimeloyl-ACP methyl ester carboxylesterase